MDTSDPLSLNLYTYCVNNPVRYVDPSGRSGEDILAGILFALDENLTDGFLLFLIRQIKGNSTTYNWESEEDYYLGRVIGAAISLGVGAYSTYTGILEIIAAIAGGGAVTVFSGGTAAGGAAVICVEGVAIGAAEIAYGVTVLSAASGGLNNELDNYQEAKNKKGDLEKVKEEYLKDTGIDAHQLKKDILGGKAPITEYDIYKDKSTGELFIFKKGGKGPGISTGEYLK